ncbi:hypothetical protein Q7P37_000877 [Cladosporium fusiforme]
MAEEARKPHMQSSASSSTSASDTSRTSRYVNEGKAKAIQQWNAQVVAGMSNNDNTTMTDPSVQAYIEAKMALLQSLASAS